MWEIKKWVTRSLFYISRRRRRRAIPRDGKSRPAWQGFAGEGGVKRNCSRIRRDKEHGVLKAYTWAREAVHGPRQQQETKNGKAHVRKPIEGTCQQRTHEWSHRESTRQAFMFGSHWFKSYLRKAPSHRHNTANISLTPPLQVTEFVSVLGRTSAQWEEEKRVRRVTLPQAGSSRAFLPFILP